MGKYLDERSVEENRLERLERLEEKAALKRKAAWRRWMYVLALAAGVTGMVYMITHQLIDLTIGVWLLAAVSAICGRGTA